MPRFNNILRRAALFVTALVVIPAAAQAQDLELIDIGTATGSTLDVSKSGPMSHIEADLRSLYDEYQADKSGRLADGYVTVDILATSLSEAEALERSLMSVGFEPTGRIGALLSGFLPVPAVGDAAEVSALRSLRASRAVARRGGERIEAPLVTYRTGASPLAGTGPLVGAVTGEASKALRADLARSTYGVNGSGVMIGVLSDSYNSLGTAAADVTSSDLPSGLVVLDDLGSGVGSDEGRAMLQLAYDVAPGSQLAFHTGFKGLANFAQGIIDLRDAGADVIVDDLTLSTEPFFQDGLVAQAVDYIATQGIPYFTSAGNESNESYEGDYVDSGIALTVDGTGAGQLHDFDTGAGVDTFLDVLLNPGESIGLSFGYDEPSAAASGIPGSTIFVGALGQAPTSDYDVYVLNSPVPVATAANVLDSSTDANATTGFPLERLDYTNTTENDQTVYIAISKFSGDNRRVKLYNSGGSGDAFKSSEYVGASTAVGHANATNGFTVAAAAWFNTAAFNTTVASNQGTAGPASLESSTSIGGLLVRLDIDGNRLSTPSDRMKPDATGSDGDNNTFFGSDTSQDSDTNPNFFGTSAAAPNVSGVAALMIEAAGGPGSLTAFEVYDALKNTSTDLRPGPGYNEGTTAGHDIRSGVGFIDAERAVAAVSAALAAPLTGAEGYRMLAHPAGGTVDDLLGSTYTQGFPGSDDPAQSYCSVYSYDETAGTYSGGYTCVAGQTSAIPQGTGVLAYIFEDEDRALEGTQVGFPKVITASGVPASAPFSAFTITYTDGATTGVEEEGWNLLGNPFANGFDWDSVNRTGALLDAVYVYDPSYLGGDFRPYSPGIGGALTDGLVPSLQGFFVKASSVPAGLEIPASAIANPGPVVYGLDATENRPSPLRLELSIADSDSGIAREVSAAFVGATEGAALGLDRSDAYRLAPSAWPRTVLSTMANDSDGTPVALSINALPASVTGDFTVPVRIVATGHEPGELPLSISWTGSLPSGWSAVLHDRESGDRLELTPGRAHTFVAVIPAPAAVTRSTGAGIPVLPAVHDKAAETEYDSGDRFELLVTPARVVSTEEGEASWSLGPVMPNPARGVARLALSLPEPGEVTVAVFDALGRQVASERQAVAAGSQQVQIPVRTLAPGAYVVRVESASGTATRRLIVTR